MKPASLDEHQRWLLTAITHPAGVAAGAPSEVTEVILPSRQQSAAERLAVYSHAYFARLLEVLRELFPCVRYAVGDELFDEFAVGYLVAHPPASYTLHRLADQFADHLEATRPKGNEQFAFIVDLARLEHAIDQVFDGPGPEDLPPPDPAELAAGHIALVPGCQLLAFRFPASSYFTAWKAGDKPAWPQPGEQFVALLRRDYIVRRYELTRSQYHLLSQLAADKSLDQALAAISGDADSLDTLAEDIRRSFTFWAGERFFVAP
jgi:hypothetical protein